MRKYITAFAIVIALAASQARAQQIPAYKAEQLMKRLASNEDTLYITVLWATWCGPCVKELPEFDKLADKYKGHPVKVLLVSMDFKKDYQSKLPKFINKRKLAHEVVWLNESNANEYMPKISDEWQGTIPATLLYYKKNNWIKFHEGMIKSEQLSVLIDKQLSALY